MLNLFQSFFGGEKSRSHYPESLIEAAIERAVDGTDARLRHLPGYRNRLRKPVIHAVDHVVALIDALPAPLAAGREDFSTDPRLAALFVSAAQMLEVFGRDRALNAYMKQASVAAERVTALLMAERVEKNVLGVDQVGGQLRRDVAQVTVSFRKHQLMEAAEDEAESRRLLKRRAFDHLLALALARIVEMRGERADLVRQRDVLRHKLAMLARNGWGFDAADAEDEAEAADPASLQSDLADVEQQLQELGADSGVLGTHLECVADLLSQAEQQLKIENVCMRLDSMNIQRDAQDAAAHDIVLPELHNARGQRSVLLLVSLTPGELPQQENLLATAHRYL
ncbi:hypothetical protein [Thiobacillus sp.]|uniref:hypothetical protein n=1 Tax=Thiobacillus sp. TaxID=924 RepID=UPI00286EA799|nr:hypothetical protein [Thiobacillus sp.]